MADNVHDVASMIIASLGPIDTYRLQKLVYYSQAWHLVRHGEPLFVDEVEAWAKGPVVRSLYRAHRGAFGVATWPTGDHARLSNQGREIVTWVVGTYGRFTGDELSRMTHAEAPWRLARAGVQDGEWSDERIDRTVMRGYYARLRRSPEAAVAAAVGSARLEGVELSAGDQYRLNQVAAGERSADDAVSEILAKYRR